MLNPFKFTKEEKEMMKEDWKKTKKPRAKIKKSYDRNNFLKPTVSSQNKKKISDEVLDFL